jgi:drug/metabolite transporter (DMT)-like permease
MIYETLLLISEVVLSAYPLLIKLVDTSVFFQTGLRMIIFTVLAIAGSAAVGAPALPDVLFSTETIATGFLNLLHVLASYFAFDTLAAGNAMALFYTYPVWNMLGSALAFKEKIPLKSLPWIGLAFVGAVLLSQPTKTNWSLLGVVAALVAALTETGIYLWFKSHKDDESDQPFTKMTQMYGSSGVLWVIAAIVLVATGFLAKGAFGISLAGLGGVAAFNAFVGFLGYAMRFYIIPKVSTVGFSALSFFGVISAYLLSWLFIGETPSMTQGIGAAAIIVANAVLLRKEIA